MDVQTFRVGDRVRIRAVARYQEDFLGKIAIVTSTIVVRYSFKGGVDKYVNNCHLSDYDIPFGWPEDCLELVNNGKITPKEFMKNLKQLYKDTLQW